MGFESMSGVWILFEVSLAKAGANSIWGLILSRNDVPYNVKRKIYEVVLRAIICYPAQVWGVKRYEVIEQLQRFFIKKLLCLPQYTPTYAIHLESGLEATHCHIVNIHLNYAAKVLALPTNRL